MKRVYAWRDGKVREIDPFSTPAQFDEMIAPCRRMQEEWFDFFMDRECQRLKQELDSIRSPLFDLLRK